MHPIHGIPLSEFSDLKDRARSELLSRRDHEFNIETPFFDPLALCGGSKKVVRLQHKFRLDSFLHDAKMNLATGLPI